MRILRACVWILMVLGLVLPKCVQGAPADAKRLHKLIVFPAEAETAAELRATGVEVEDFGSYWLVKADKSRTEAIRKARGPRALTADHFGRIELLSVQFDTAEGEPAVPGQLRETFRADKQLRLVQFVGPVQPQWVDMLKSAGKVRIVGYVPNNAYIVRLDQASENNIAQFLSPHGPVQWIGAYHPYYKIQRGLLPAKPAKGDPLVPLRVAVIEGADADAAVEAVRSYSKGVMPESFVQLDHRIVQIFARVSDISKIALIPDVVWIERVVPRAAKDEKQDLILASRTNQLPSHSPIPPTLGGERYLDFLFDKVAGGLASFTNSATYPIVDIADTGLEIGRSRTAHPAFYDLGDPTRGSRVVYATRAGFPNGTGCPPFSEFFNGAEDFVGHGTFVASIVAGYDNGQDETIFPCSDTRQVPQCFGLSGCGPRIVVDTNLLVLVRKDTEGFQRGMGVSPFGLIGSTRIFEQNISFECLPYAITAIGGEFCATSLPVLMAQEYLNRARIANNSWGDILLADPEGNIVNAGLYTVDSQSYDIGVRDALLTGTTVTNVPGPFPLNQELIAVFAGGNAGSVGNVGGFGDILVTAPATAKNIITVGATENFRTTGDGCFTAVEQDNTFDISGFSAFGPTLDGRFRPDILAPGAAIFGANDFLSFDEVIESCNCSDGAVSSVSCHPVPGVQECLNTAPNWPRESGLYVCSAGTSFSAPAVSGGLQLLWWYFQNRLNLLQPSPAMAKAYLLNSARYLPIVNPITQTVDTLPSIAQGMGMMDLERMFDSVPRTLRDQTTPRAIDVTLLLTNPIPQQTYFTRTGQSYELSGTVFDATKPFRVSLAWTDAPGNLAANGALVNNLDLEVSVGGRTYRGNIFAGAFSVVDNNRGADEVNNIESVFLPAGTTGTWSIVVRAINVAGDGVPNVGVGTDQDFALVVYNTATPSDVPNSATNDTCQTATPILSFPYSASLSLSSPTFHNNHPSPSAGRGGIEAFWTLGRLTQGTAISVDTFGSNFDTVLSIWKGTCGSLVEEVSNNNISGTLQSSVSFTADGTNSYYIVVDKRAGAGSSLALNVTAVLPPISVTPAVLNFGSLPLNISSSPMTAIYTNRSQQSSTIDTVQIQGADAHAFSLVDDTCNGQTIPVGGGCFVQLVFTPTNQGPHTATLVFSDNRTGSPRLVELVGNGLAPSPRICGPSSVSFGNIATDNSSTQMVVTIRNCGSAPLTITNATITGTGSNEFSIVSNGCLNTPVAVDGTCQLSLVFSPTVTGNRTATLNLFGGDAGVFQIALSGSSTGSQPDALISRSRRPKTFVGENIYNSDGTGQSSGTRAGRGKKRVFFVKVQNDGNAVDTFRVAGTGDVVQGTSVRYFLGAMPKEALDITDAVKAGTFTTSSLAPGAMTGDATLIRVEVKVDKLAISGFYDTQITVTSVANPGRSDTVKASVVVP